ncbi:DUF2000 domain-containing protein [Actinospica robiniae]|uniref:DUF2000 domain-containing protein n=1 Tax=Actinospica robiniae TaxID=304901 RepID=UPI0003F98F27|nr:DUF2000 domain-containing protein [Actinospica robiniae]
MSLIENVAAPFDKCAIVVDGELPVGLAMNAAAVLAFSLGDSYGQGVLGTDVKDRDGQVHRAITAAPIPILRSDAVGLKALVAKAAADPELFMVDFTAVAQAARDYDDYSRNMGGMSADEHVYVGLALAGFKKAVNKLTGSMPLYR